MYIYLCGKLESPDTYEVFEKAESWLKLQGHEVVNPAKWHDVLPKKMTDNQRIECYHTFIRICDTIFLVDGWQNDKFAREELEYAKLLGRKPMYQRHYKEYRKKKGE